MAAPKEFFRMYLMQNSFGSQLTLMAAPKEFFRSL
jgi:hypothetical protein